MATTCSLSGTIFTLYGEPASTVDASDSLEHGPDNTVMGQTVLKSIMTTAILNATVTGKLWPGTKKCKLLISAEGQDGIHALFLEWKSGDTRIESTTLSGKCFYVHEGDIPTWDDLLAMGDTLSEDFMGEDGSAALVLKPGVQETETLEADHQ